MIPGNVSEGQDAATLVPCLTCGMILTRGHTCLASISGAASCLLCGKPLGAAHQCIIVPELSESSAAYLARLAASRTDYSVYTHLRVHGPEWTRGRDETDLKAHLRYCHIPPDAPYHEWEEVISRAMYPVTGESV